MNAALQLRGATRLSSCGEQRGSPAAGSNAALQLRGATRPSGCGEQRGPPAAAGSNAALQVWGGAVTSLEGGHGMGQTHNLANAFKHWLHLTMESDQAQQFRREKRLMEADHTDLMAELKDKHDAQLAQAIGVVKERELEIQHLSEKVELQREQLQLQEQDMERVQNAVQAAESAQNTLEESMKTEIARTEENRNMEMAQTVAEVQSLLTGAKMTHLSHITARVQLRYMRHAIEGWRDVAERMAVQNYMMDVSRGKSAYTMQAAMFREWRRMAAGNAAAWRERLSDVYQLWNQEREMRDAFEGWRRQIVQLGRPHEGDPVLLEELQAAEAERDAEAGRAEHLQQRLYELKAAGDTSAAPRERSMTVVVEEAALQRQVSVLGKELREKQEELDKLRGAAAFAKRTEAEKYALAETVKELEAELQKIKVSRAGAGSDLGLIQAPQAGGDDDLKVHTPDRKNYSMLVEQEYTETIDQLSAKVDLLTTQNEALQAVILDDGSSYQGMQARLMESEQAIRSMQEQIELMGADLQRARIREMEESAAKNRLLAVVTAPRGASF
ncbi:hypothetical protein CYMTET_25161 [Cymbomonas tetramitiformis]|uniref:Uncharacterized protein n=1 Tax=Cymbomonas tetramitiformis TaxID=36881 RepID=A0AAE0FUM0_9CHLO|nr:hypothetical protein CYMTET_25161 [Cymbomonas tetramitiformis]